MQHLPLVRRITTKGDDRLATDGPDLLVSYPAVTLPSYLSRALRACFLFGPNIPMERWQPENSRKEEEEEEKEEEAEISRMGGGGAEGASPPPPPSGSKRPKLLRFRSDKRFIVFVVAMAVFTV